MGTRVVDAAVADHDAPRLDDRGDLASWRIAKAACVRGPHGAPSARDSARTMASHDVQKNTNIVTNVVGVNVTVTQLPQQGDQAIDIPRLDLLDDSRIDVDLRLDASELRGHRGSLFPLVVLAGDIQADAQARGADAMDPARDTGEDTGRTIPLAAERTLAHMRNDELDRPRQECHLIVASELEGRGKR
jgi:hypothetical protein